MSRTNPDGSWREETTAFRSEISPGGRFPPAKGRYHLYAAYMCPFAHRVLIARKLKGLQDYIDVSIVHPHLLTGGWHFVPTEFKDRAPAPPEEHSSDSFPGATVDKVYGAARLSELYKRANPDFSGRISVPVLWDTKEGTVVNNESADILRNLNTAFNSLLPEQYASVDLYPTALRLEIDEVNDWVQKEINIGVYRAGFATSQTAYDTAVRVVVRGLERAEKRLEGRRYLVGEQLTEADVRLYTTIVRYDGVYYILFKCNWGMIRHDYPNLNRWLKNLYWNVPAFKDTTRFDHIKEGYYFTKGLPIPLGPNVWVEPLDKDE